MLRNLVCAIWIGTVLPAIGQTPAQAGPSTMRFDDPPSGIHFRYPASWKILRGDEAHGPDPIFTEGPNAPTPHAVRVSSTQDTWPKLANNTNFTGADFIFNIEPGTSGKDCMDRIGRPLGALETKRINGVPFLHTTFERAWTCHEVSESIYVDYRAHACYMFDLVVNTICAGVIEGEREWTPAEKKQVYAQLEQILSTVRIDSISNPSAADRHP